VRIASLLLVSSLAGCTPGAPPAGNGSAAAAAVTIDVSLTASVVAATAYGSSGGYMPAVTNVALGQTVRFVNVDSFAHTATSLGDLLSFPQASPFDASALRASGTALSGRWTSGALAAGNASPPLLADRPGIYLYGCFFHYPAPMRAAIVVR